MRRRCEQCRRPTRLCYCGLLPDLSNACPVHILQHREEASHPLGTARMAALGLRHATLDVLEGRFRPGQGDVLIYPGEQAAPVTELREQAGLRPVFLDASWRKSRRWLHEQPDLAALPRYRLESVPPSRYRIRREPRAGWVSTLEAIVWTLETVEQAPGRYQPLLRVMDWVIDQQIRHMGEATWRRNYRDAES